MTMVETTTTSKIMQEEDNIPSTPPKSHRRRTSLSGLLTSPTIKRKSLSFGSTNTTKRKDKNTTAAATKTTTAATAVTDDDDCAELSSSSFRTMGNIIVEIDPNDNDDYEDHQISQSTLEMSDPLDHSPPPSFTSPRTSRRRASLRKMLLAGPSMSKSIGRGLVLDEDDDDDEEEEEQDKEEQDKEEQVDETTVNTSTTTRRRMSLREIMLARYATGQLNGATSGNTTRRKSAFFARRQQVKKVQEEDEEESEDDDEDGTITTAELSSMDFTVGSTGGSSSPSPSQPGSPPIKKKVGDASSSPTIMSPQLQQEMEEMKMIMRTLKDKLGFNPVEISSPSVWEKEDEDESSSFAKKVKNQGVVEVVHNEEKEDLRILSTLDKALDISSEEEESDTNNEHNEENDEELLLLRQEQEEMQSIAKQLQQLIGFDPKSNHPIDRSLSTLQQRVTKVYTTTPVDNEKNRLRKQKQNKKKKRTTTTTTKKSVETSSSAASSTTSSAASSTTTITAASQ